MRAALGASRAGAGSPDSPNRPARTHRPSSVRPWSADSTQLRRGAGAAVTPAATTTTAPRAFDLDASLEPPALGHIYAVPRRLMRVSQAPQSGSRPQRAVGSALPTGAVAGAQSVSPAPPQPAALPLEADTVPPRLVPAAQDDAETTTLTPAGWPPLFAPSGSPSTVIMPSVGAEAGAAATDANPSAAPTPEANSTTPRQRGTYGSFRKPPQLMTEDSLADRPPFSPKERVPRNCVSPPPPTRLTFHDSGGLGAQSQPSPPPQSPPRAPLYAMTPPAPGSKRKSSPPPQAVLPTPDHTATLRQVGGASTPHSLQPQPQPQQPHGIKSTTNTPGTTPTAAMSPVHITQEFQAPEVPAGLQQPRPQTSPVRRRKPRAALKGPPSSTAAFVSPGMAATPAGFGARPLRGRGLMAPLFSVAGHTLGAAPTPTPAPAAPNAAPRSRAASAPAGRRPQRSRRVPAASDAAPPTQQPHVGSAAVATYGAPSFMLVQRPQLHRRPNDMYYLGGDVETPHPRQDVTMNGSVSARQREGGTSSSSPLPIRSMSPESELRSASMMGPHHPPIATVPQAPEEAEPQGTPRQSRVRDITPGDVLNEAGTGEEAELSGHNDSTRSLLVTVPAVETVEADRSATGDATAAGDDQSAVSPASQLRR